MSMFISKLQSARRSAQAQIKKQQAFNATLRAQAQELKPYFEMFPPSLRKDVYMQADWYDSSIRMSLSLRNLDSFKDEKLTRLLEKFADWEAVSTDYTYDNQPNRDFIFTHQTPFGIRIKVSIYAYVKSDSPLCRVVVKGTTTRVVEEEIREIVCE
jgi:DUF4097 and DUF4098 domain-containing protein YvlB